VVVVDSLLSAEDELADISISRRFREGATVVDVDAQVVVVDSLLSAEDELADISISRRFREGATVVVVDAQVVVDSLLSEEDDSDELEGVVEDPSASRRFRELLSVVDVHVLLLGIQIPITSISSTSITSDEFDISLSLLLLTVVLEPISVG